MMKHSAVPGISAPEEKADGKMLTVLNKDRGITEDDVKKMIDTFQKYVEGKKILNQRLIEDERWYQLRHNELTGNNESTKSAWLHNTLSNKHADMMDNYPDENFLPREQSDIDSAKKLSAIIPVIRERNNYEQVYSDNCWEKLKHGTAVYGHFLNPELENGLGDIEIRGIDLLNLYWQPGISNIQSSRMVFNVELVDNDLLKEQYPDAKTGGADSIAKYIYDDQVDVSDKTAVIDCYYKVRNSAGQKVLQYCKITSGGGAPLYASENDAGNNGDYPYIERGYYDHGKYPFVFDVLFPQKGTPVGYGYIEICKDPQLYIDAMKGAMLQNVIVGSTPRYFMSDTVGVNEDDFLDLKKKIIKVEGNIADDKLKPIDYNPLPGNYLNLLQMEIDEMKETSSNRDMTSGGSSSGVTAAAAIAALQEAGNKTSRDMIATSYRADKEGTDMDVELIRQFYDEPRCFRITGQGNDGVGVEFVDFSNAEIKDQTISSLTGEEMIRRPVFDIVIKPQKRNPYSQMSQNEQAKELYKLGAFQPERAQESLMMLDMMEFEGKDEVREKVAQGQTMMNMLKQSMAQCNQLASLVQQLTGQQTGVGMGGAMPGANGAVNAQTSGGSATSLESAAKNAQQATMTSYGQKLAERAKPSLDKTPAATQPQM